MKRTVFSLFFLTLSLFLHAKPLVYDCFPFFNELELLKIRLDELHEVVDYFVLVESIETQTGLIKPFYFEENKHLFKKYLPKIIHLKIKKQHQMEMWGREHYQRNFLSKGLKGCHPDDVIMISDVDEIPKASTVHALKKLLRRTSGAKEKVMAVEQDIFFFHLNRQSPTWLLWHGTVATTFFELSKKNPQHFRNMRDTLPCIKSGGWHFTWMGGKDKVRQKLVSVVEGSKDGLQMSDEALDLWINSHSLILPIDDRFPKYVQKNQQYLKEIGFIADQNRQP